MPRSLSSTTEVGRNLFLFRRDSPSEMLPRRCIMLPHSGEEKTLVALKILRM